ncbi:MAG: hypothetical protein D6730_14945 [Bacteroidetes bacterium]|nr:MAG: hypothetical protein D6730_14945 [Bacteroidota bacterium]
MSYKLDNFDNRKVGKLLNTLNVKEKKQFLCWLKSELSPKLYNVQQLYEMLVEGKAAEEIWRELFPGSNKRQTPFQDARFRKVESQLVAFLEEFLAIASFRKSRYARDLYLVKALNERDSSDLFDKEVRKVKRKIDKKFRFEREYYFMMYQLELEQQVQLNRDHTKRKAPAASLGHALDIWWLHEKLWLANHDLNFQNIKDEPIATLFVNEILELLDQEPQYQGYPLVEIYQKLYLLLRKGEGDAITVQQLIRQHAHLMGKRELKDTFSLLFNYYARKAKTYQEGPYTLNILFELVKWGIEDEIIFTNGFLPWNWYKNLITLCIHLGKLKEAYTYIHEFKPRLRAEEQADAFRFNLAHYHFASKHFRKAIKMLSPKYSNVYYEMHARLLMCKACYELEETDGLETRLRSLRVFINRQKAISPLLKKAYVNKIKLFEDLLKAYRVKDFEKLYQKIQHIKPLNADDWFLEKIQAHLSLSPS